MKITLLSLTCVCHHPIKNHLQVGFGTNFIYFHTTIHSIRATPSIKKYVDCKYAASKNPPHENQASHFYLLFFVSTLLIHSEEKSQAERRIENKTQIGGFVTPKANITVLNFSYAFHKHFSLTFTGSVRRGGTLSHLNFDETTLSVGMESVRWSSDTNMFFLGIEYYPLEKIPFYLTGYIGIQKTSGSTQQEYYTLNPLNPEAFIQTNSFSYSVTPKRSGLVGIGFGFKWQFSNGIFIGFQIGNYYTNEKRDIYVYNEFRPNTTVSLEQTWIHQKYLEHRLSDYEYQKMAYPYIGFSF